MLNTKPIHDSNPARPDAFFIVAVLGIVVALVLHAVIAYATLRRPFDVETHAWASASSSVIARSYAQQGILPLHGLQIANNPPLGTQPDAYIHWPPLFTMALSRLFLVFGESEAIAHACALVISMVCAITVFFLVRVCFGTRVALGAVFGFLTMPAFFVFTRLVQGTMLAILFEMLALLAFIKGTDKTDPKHGWRRIGLVALVFGVLTSWEPLLLPPTLVAIALLQRDRQRLQVAMTYLVAGAFAFGAVMTLYLSAAPYLAIDLWHTILVRARWTSALSTAAAPPSLHSIPNMLYYYQLFTQAGQVSFTDITKICADHFRTLLGIGPLVMMAFVIVKLVTIRKTETANTKALLFVGLLGPWMLWYVLMPNQVIDNNFQVLLAVPAAAASVGIVFVALHDVIRHRQPGGALPIRIVVAIALAVYLLWPLAAYVRDWAKPQPPTGLVEYARDVEQSTPPNAVVLVPFPSMVPVYYARRHVLRAALDDAAVRLMLSRVDEVFPGSPVYLALPPYAPENWKESARNFQSVHVTAHLVLLQIGTAGEGRMARVAGLLPADTGP